MKLLREACCLFCTTSTGVVIILLMMQANPVYSNSSGNSSFPKRSQPAAVYVLLYFFSAFLVILTVCGNLLVIISISHFRQLHTPTNILILSLAVADLLLGIFGIPFAMIKIIENCWYFGEILCLVYKLVAFFLTSVSISNLVFIAVDRYIALCDPLRYTSIITVYFVSIFIALGWDGCQHDCFVILNRFCFFNALVDYTLTSVSVSNLIFIAIDRYVAICDPLLYSAKITVPIVHVCVGDCQGFYAESWVLMEFIIMFFIPCAVMASLYSKIFLVARRHLKIINSVNQQICTKELHQNKRPKNSERKAAKTLGIVISVYFICWVPFYTCKIIYTYTTLPVPNVFFNVLVWLIYFNSGMNPIIYALFYPWFKKSVKLIMTLKICNLESSLINLFSVNN
uniref:G-protein coupled receptors family 1 profile domain-containing protein n=1 Tax=Erpetoichthys calabaricus TaxID=27687 RepID=A0A8C4RKE6_ERPCA